MTSARFRETVVRLEASAARSPKAYRWSVVAMAILGYGYVLALLVLSLIAVAALVSALIRGDANAGTIKLLLIVSLFAIMVLRALWVRLPPPQGRVLTPEDAPRLFELVEDLRARLAAPRFHRILLTEELNAAIVQTPRLGVFGWYSNSLLIGLPLLQALSLTEFTAVLAHEMGHVSGNHGKLSSWIYRIRLTWAQLRVMVEESRHLVANLLIGRFLRWFEPAFAARSFVLARAHEYEADRIAAEASGADAAGRALAKLEVLGRHLSERFWPRVYQQVSATPEPAASPLQQLLPSIRRIPDDAVAQRWLQQAWRRPTDYDDTHPSLSDRLRALGWQTESLSLNELSSPASDGAPSAAQVLLGSKLESHASALDASWRENVTPRWRVEYEAREGARQRLAALAGRGDRSIEEDWERVQLVGRLEGSEAAIPVAEELLLKKGDHAGALLLIGKARLDAGDVTGVDLVERAGVADPSFALTASSMLFEFFWNRGDRARAERHRARCDDREELHTRAVAERQSLKPVPVLVSPDLPAERFATFREAIRKIEGLEEVFVARRVVELLPEQPCYLVGVLPRRRWYRYESAQGYEKLLQQVVSVAPSAWEMYYVVLVGQHKKLIKLFRNVPGAAMLHGKPLAAAPLSRELELSLLSAQPRKSRGGLGRFVRRTAGIGIVALTALVVLGNSIRARSVNRVIPLRSFTARGAAHEIASTDGRVRLVVIYSTGSDPEYIDWLSRVALRHRHRLVYLPFSIARSSTKARDYLWRDLRNAIPPLWITPYEKGELGAAMGQVGVPVPVRFSTPLITVLDPAGREVASWEYPDFEPARVQVVVDSTVADWEPALP